MENIIMFILAAIAVALIVAILKQLFKKDTPVKADPHEELLRNAFFSGFKSCLIDPNTGLESAYQEYKNKLYGKKIQ